MVIFWNGNKSTARQHHELDVLQYLLAGSESPSEIQNDMTDYPNAEDESNIFFRGVDLFVTVAGNQKFSHRQFFSVPHPVCEGILGCRLLIIRRNDIPLFQSVTLDLLQEKTAGIPATWADADIFRHNHLPVCEAGNIRDILHALQQGECDYVSLGINEAEEILSQHPEIAKDLCIEPTTLIYYPLPLVFYVSPLRPDLKRLLNTRAQHCCESGEMAQLVYRHYGKYIRRARLKHRHVIYLDNPFLPEDFTGFDFFYC
ncbi:hypothetical protein VA7868_04231 [Vibrio aerogenes CECT 7868]|uniref:Bacterial extracellular solute-binding proteins, family 3 n=1 Tax=Vibrio aerogenes CECT 7868 TaxID=1216006 RepID=A0A1M6DHR2_9VIBR|nr:hypothetical protein [Vibrio aerogenes]SHI72579.1 hypothetical protein VA7868_04231 [Vibrio aerogenes CECT 7868]